MAGSQQDFPVLEDGRPIGVLTRQDIVAALQKGGVDQRVGEVMTRGELAADVNEPLEGAMARMRERSIGSLPVLDRGRLVGVLTLENIGDLLTVRDALRRYASAPQPHSAS
jgi:CBS domain-containing protein